VNFQSSQFGIFGWNQFAPAQVQATTTSNGNIEITNAASLFSLLPEQKSGTALYEANSPNMPVGQLAEQLYDLSIQDLIPQQGVSAIEFELQADGTYKLKGSGSATLTKVGN
jgi:hypothetical protein